MLFGGKRMTAGIEFTRCQHLEPRSGAAAPQLLGEICTRVDNEGCAAARSAPFWRNMNSPSAHAPHRDLKKQMPAGKTLAPSTFKACQPCTCPQ